MELIEFEKVKVQNVNQYQLHECSYKNNSGHYFMHLFLKYDSFLQSLFVRNYQTGLLQWIPLNEFFKGDSFNLKINMLKGSVNLKSYKLTPLGNNSHASSLIENFWNLLRFEIFTKTNDIILEDSEELIMESECEKCTYKIEKHEYRKCQWCHVIYHKDCVVENNNNSILSKRKSGR